MEILEGKNRKSMDEVKEKKKGAQERVCIMWGLRTQRIEGVDN